MKKGAKTPPKQGVVLPAWFEASEIRYERSSRGSLASGVGASRGKATLRISTSRQGRSCRCCAFLKSISAALSWSFWGRKLLGSLTYDACTLASIEAHNDKVNAEPTHAYATPSFVFLSPVHEDLSSST